MNISETILTLSNQNNATVDATPTVNELRQTALGQLQHMQQQEKTLIQVRSNLDLLMQRYNAEKGLFSRAAEWYGSRSWWLKILFALIIIGIAVGIGALCHMPIALGCTAAGIYLFAAFLFINHYAATEKRNKRLCEDVLEMEHSLNDAVTHFATLSDSLKKVMVNLCEMNCQMTEHLEKLASQHQQLGEKVISYQTMVNTLSTAKTNLTEQIDKITQKLQEVSQVLQTTQDIAISQSEQLIQTTQNIDVIHTNLQQDEILLRKETEALHAVTGLIVRCYEAFQPIFTTLSEMAANETNQLCLLDKTPQELEVKPHTPDLSHLEAIYINAETLIKQQTQQQEKMALNNQDIEQSHADTALIIQRAQALLQKRGGKKAIKTLDLVM